MSFRWSIGSGFQDSQCHPEAQLASTIPSTPPRKESSRGLWNACKPQKNDVGGRGRQMIFFSRLLSAPLLKVSLSVVQWKAY